jgi:hypothetical protein
MNKHREFMSHRPPVFTHAADPLDADDWLKTVGKMLTTTQCDVREKVLYDAGRLQGSAGAWWDAYVTAHLRQTPLPGRSSPTASGATTFLQG